MIPNSTNKLLIAEDWKKLYQSIKNTDLKSYDFDSLRRVMITYLRENYPEDFNDFIDSSEYIALIELIAYIGQNLSFRIDLNARENFLETAERRESILRLAKLINYNPKRNAPASGLLKIQGVSTTDNVLDANGINLANALISWNDSTNPEWYQQFITIMNSAMIEVNAFGKPYKAATVAGIQTEQYRLNSANSGVPLYSFNKIINGLNLSFEIINSTFVDSIQEEDPRPNNSFSLLFKNDNQGNGSSNSGFFVLFKQGVLGSVDFTIDNPVSNEIVGIDAANINETDVWLWQLTPSGEFPDTPWVKVPATTGNNIIYNSLSNNQRNIYSVISRENDQIDLSFSDGNFGNLPLGNFRLFYRQSAALNYSIAPSQMSNISFTVEYYNKLNQLHALTFIASLNYTVNNATSTESNESIKSKAPQVYYSQGRMITAEDYNIVPLLAGTDIVKVKSVNRISSGISKYYELSDVSGKYSNLNIYCKDGILYKDLKDNVYEFQLTNKNELKTIFQNVVSNIIESKSFRNFYYDQFTRIDLNESNIEWKQGTNTFNQSTGYFSSRSLPLAVGDSTENNLRFIRKGALIKFKAPTIFTENNTTGIPEQTYFLPNGKLTFIEDETTNLYKWSKVISVEGNGYNNGVGLFSNGVGPILLSEVIPTSSLIVEIIPAFLTVLGNELENRLIDYCLTKTNFGITIDQEINDWFIIDKSNIDLVSNFNTLYQKETINFNRDASWLVSFEWTGIKYKLRYRTCNYIFESERETSFFIDFQEVNYDYASDSVIKDKITVLGINSKPNLGLPLLSDQDWQIDESIIDADGYQNPNMVSVSFFDKDNDGMIDNPDSFIDIVNPAHISAQTGYRDNFIVFQLQADSVTYRLIDKKQFYFYPSPSAVPTELAVDGQLFYFYAEDYEVVMKYMSLTQEYALQSGYKVRPGRSNLKFHYVHKAPELRRLDPSKSNIIDIYVLTKDYDTNYKNWLASDIGLEPLPLSTSVLDSLYKSNLDPFKSISDEIIFYPVKYKILFGNRAPSNLQGTFKAVRNISRPISDNDIKSRILTAINEFFAVENWEFGQTFYFSELSAYVMNKLTPDILNFVIVSKNNNAFGSLFEIKCGPDELFISSASAIDIEVIDGLTSNELKTQGTVITDSRE